MNNRRRFDEAERLMDEFERFEGFGGEEDARHARFQLPNGSNYREHLLTLPDQQDQYSTSASTMHWGNRPNVLAHIRMNDRVVPGDHDQLVDALQRSLGHPGGIEGAVNEGLITPQEGASIAREMGMKNSPLYDKPGLDKKILHVEEMQSDWNNDARRKGFRTGNEQSDLDKLTNEMRQQVMDSTRNEYVGFDSPGMQQQMQENLKKVEKMDPYTLSLKTRRTNEYNQLSRAADPVQGPVPRAPYVNPDKEEWSELAMKHVIMEAAKGGYDGVSFTPDAEQENRWNGTKFDGMYDRKFPGIAARLAQQHDPSTRPALTQVPSDIRGTGMVPAAMVPLSGDAKDSINKNGFSTFRRGGYVVHERRAK